MKFKRRIVLWMDWWHLRSGITQSSAQASKKGRKEVGDKGDSQYWLHSDDFLNVAERIEFFHTVKIVISSLKYRLLHFAKPFSMPVNFSCSEICSIWKLYTPTFLWLVLPWYIFSGKRLTLFLHGPKEEPRSDLLYFQSKYLTKIGSYDFSGPETLGSLSLSRGIGSL